MLSLVEIGSLDLFNFVNVFSLFFAVIISTWKRAEPSFEQTFKFLPLFLIIMFIHNDTVTSSKKIICFCIKEVNINLHF